MKVLNEMSNMHKSPLVTKIDLDDKIGVYDWHSFCVALNLVEKIVHVVQNGKIIVIKHFDSAYEDFTRLKNLMQTVYIGSFRGFVTDTQVFSRPLGTDEMERWTLCEDSKILRK